MTTYLSNAFSLSMLPDSIQNSYLPFVANPMKEQPALQDGKFVSIVGHQDIADIIAAKIGVEVPVNRVSITLEHGDYLFVAQYIGPRLPEGTKFLPPGAEIKWYFVRQVPLAA